MKLHEFETSQSFFYENGFYLTSDKKRLGKLVAHYELYKKIIDLPGAVVEIGVFKGASLIRFATFRDLLESSDSRTIIGFDNFGQFPVPEDVTEADLQFIGRFESSAGFGIGDHELEEVLNFKNITNFELIAGDIAETIPKYIRENPHLRIALLHIDVDVYFPSKTALENLYDNVVPGGLILFDDYGTVDGETRAVDEFIMAKNLTLRKLSCAHVPSYIIKP